MPLVVDARISAVPGGDWDRSPPRVRLAPQLAHRLNC
jgi:hypothetical protein